MLALGASCAGSEISGGDSDCSALSNPGCHSPLQAETAPSGAAGAAALPVRDAGAPVAGSTGAPQSTGNRSDAGTPPPDAGSPRAAGAGGSPAPMPMGGAGGTADTDDVPMTAHCLPAAEWSGAWEQFELEVLRLTNEARSKGADCGTEGKFGATTALAMSPILRCSARLHSADMGEKNYFDHTNKEGLNPFQRMMMAGYSGQAMGENIAKGQQTPASVVAGWLDSDGHCRNIMDPDYTEIGVGYWEGTADTRGFNGNKLWTQNFGHPRSARN